VVQGKTLVIIDAGIMSPQDAGTASLADIGAIESARVMSRNGLCHRVASADF